MNIALNNQTINNKMQRLTMNANSLPYNYTKDDLEWDFFKKLVYNNIESRLKNIILRMYKWTLPETMNERIIEYGFLERGYVTVFKDELGIFALPCIPNGYYNIYGEPTQVSAYGYNGWNRIVDIKYFANYPQIQGMNLQSKEDNYGVVARDNYDNKKYIDYIKEYAKILTDNRMAIIVATDTLKQPHITAVSKRALKKTANKVIKGIQDNKRQIIIIDEDIKQSGKTIKDMMSDIDLSGNIEAPKKLIEIYNANFNLFLETIGINTNPSPDKSEIVLNAELESNNSLIDLEQDVRFLNRKKLCEDVKKLFNIEMKVEKNIQEMKKLIKGMKIKEDGSDGESGESAQDSK